MEILQKSEIQFDNLVDLEKYCKMSIRTQKSALIQPRTSPPKFALFNVVFTWCPYLEVEKERYERLEGDANAHEDALQTHLADLEAPALRRKIDPWIP